MAQLVAPPPPAYLPTGSTPSLSLTISCANLIDAESAKGNPCCIVSEQEGDDWCERGKTEVNYSN